ncbi:MAG TPA: hypothetical protein VKF84_18725 [Candidatus Sulfotelmatobacter sp.]|nr:hypothetical protein [Candidatus Sulfotelmatobacter sp.]
MKDINLFAVDRNWFPAGRTVGSSATSVEKEGDFELVDPVSAGDRVFGIGYVTQRAVFVLFDDLRGLVDSLENFKGFSTKGFEGPLEAGGVRLLVITCHGRPGVLFIDGVDANGVNAKDFLSPSTMAKYASDLTRLGKFLATNNASKGGASKFATIRFDGCNAGADTNSAAEARGSDLLVALSQIWDGTRVVAFADYGIGRGTKKAPYTFGGAEDSNVYFSDTSTEPEFGKLKMIFSSWRSENSPNAKIAQDGIIVKRPVREVLEQPREVIEHQMATHTLDRDTIEAFGIGGASSNGAAFRLPAPVGAASRASSIFRTRP